MVPKKTMKSIRSRFICFVRFFFCVIMPKVIIYSIRFYVCLPKIPLSMPRHAFKAAFISYWFNGIFHILPSRSLTQVYQSIVRPVSVNVIYFILRPRTSIHGPNNSMRPKQYIIYSNHKISSMIFAFNLCTNFYFPTVHRPRKLAAFWVIREKTVKAFDGYRVHVGNMVTCLEFVNRRLPSHL